MLIMTAPGQGAQRPGFLAPWLELPGSVQQLGDWGELAGLDLIRLGTTAKAEEITDTANAQPLLVAAALLVAGQLPRPAALAGHSVGELAAGVVGGVLAAEDAVCLTAVRGRAMAEATRLRPTGMTAVLGGDEPVVMAAIAEHCLTAATINAAGHIVAGGTLEQLTAFAASPPPGAKLQPLRVAGAFHTAYMAPAVPVLAAASADTAVRDPAVLLLSNRDGGIVTSGKDWLERVVAQVAGPVRWDQCMATMRRANITQFIELPPAGTLSGLIRREMPAIRPLALRSPDQLDSARALMAEASADDR